MEIDFYFCLRFFLNEVNSALSFQTIVLSRFGARWVDGSLHRAFTNVATSSGSVKGVKLNFWEILTIFVG